jgi:hypothetical protein
MSSESSKKRLPFEPRQKKKPTTPKKPPLKATEGKKNQKVSSEEVTLSAIPDVVSKRMVRRMALFCGIPTALGILSFVTSYWIVSHEWFKLPTIAVVYVSLGFFGLGVLGLSYGILSTSWDEDRLGGWWGWEEFRINFKRMQAAWRSSKPKKVSDQ